MMGFLGALLFGEAMAWAVPASPEPFQLKQPDGFVFWARLWGDEWQNGTETADGYTILRDAFDRWVYAITDATGRLVPSNRVVGRDSPIGLRKHLRPPARVRPFGAPGVLPQGVQPAAPTPGTHRLLVIFIDFTPSARKGVTEAELAQHFFSGGGTYTPTSTKNYWDTVSYGTITMAPANESYGTSNNGVVMVTLSYANPLCGGNIGNCHRQLTRDAIVASDPWVNYSLFDANGDGYLSTNELHLYIVVAGNEGSFGGNSCGTPSTWAHRWSLGFSFQGMLVEAPTVDGVRVGHWRGAPTVGPYQGGYLQEGEWHEACPGHTPGHKATMGVSAHELGHDLGTGAPDLYDTCDTCGTASFGIGDWGLQGSGSWNWVPIASGNHAGTHPAFPDPWSRWFFGFNSPTAITGPTFNVSLPQIETATGANRGVYYLPNVSVSHWDDCTGGTGEYFLVENRQLVGFDAGLPGAGVLIWHIYEGLNTCTPNDDEGTSPPGNPRLVVLEQADGLFGLECYSGGQCNSGDGTDPWYSGNAATFHDATTPNSKFYSGTSSGICVTNISASGATMTADMGLSGCPTAGTAALFRIERATGNIYADGQYFCSLPSNCYLVGNADIAERIDVSEPVEPGDVVELDPDNPGRYRKARSPNSRLVAGVIASSPGFTLANRPEELAFEGPSEGRVRGLLSRLLRSPWDDEIPVSLRWTLGVLLERRPEREQEASMAQWLIEMSQGSRPVGRPLLALVGQVSVKATTENGPIRPGDLLVSAATPGYVMRCANPHRCEGAIVGKALEPLERGSGLIRIWVAR